MYGLLKVFCDEEGVDKSNQYSLDLTMCKDRTLEFRVCDENNDDVVILYFAPKNCLEIANYILRFLYNLSIKK